MAPDEFHFRTPSRAGTVPVNDAPSAEAPAPAPVTLMRGAYGQVVSVSYEIAAPDLMVDPDIDLFHFV